MDTLKMLPDTTCYKNENVPLLSENSVHDQKCHYMKIMLTDIYDIFTQVVKLVQDRNSYVPTFV